MSEPIRYGPGFNVTALDWETVIVIGDCEECGKSLATPWNDHTVCAIVGMNRAAAAAGARAAQRHDDAFFDALEGRR